MMDLKKAIFLSSNQPAVILPWYDLLNIRVRQWGIVDVAKRDPVGSPRAHIHPAHSFFCTYPCSFLFILYHVANKVERKPRHLFPGYKGELMCKRIEYIYSSALRSDPDILICVFCKTTNNIIIQVITFLTVF